MSEPHAALPESPALPADVNVVTLAYTYYNVTPDGATAPGRRLD